jgi:hypothetical protein
MIYFKFRVFDRNAANVQIPEKSVISGSQKTVFEDVKSEQS